ncbi:MAG: hypothetical protein ABL982_25300 [Vicinamibacterales bacterium]
MNARDASTRRAPLLTRFDARGLGEGAARVGLDHPQGRRPESVRWSAHWQIEEAWHWQLVVSFGEDAARIRRDNSLANIAVIRRRALDVACVDQSKGSLTGKLKRAGWDDKFMLKMLRQMR